MITIKNLKNQDNLTIKTISAPGNIIQTSNVVGNAGHEAFCIYNNERHAVGSKIENEDGREYICNSDGSWQVGNDEL